MLAQTFATLCLAASVANAHFTIESPEMRGDSFAKGASQYIYPCANVNQTAATNRTLWTLTGGSVSLDLHHPWTYAFINLGLGTDYPSFNISLTPQFLNVTGNGTLCLPKVVLPSTVVPVEGQNASIQVVTIGQSGSALYNCADITFTSKATLLSGSACANSSNVVATVVKQQVVNGSTTTTGAPAATSSKAAGHSLNSNSAMSSGIFVGVGAIIAGLLL